MGGRKDRGVLIGQNFSLVYYLYLRSHVGEILSETLLQIFKSQRFHSRREAEALVWVVPLLSTAVTS